MRFKHLGVSFILSLLPPLAVADVPSHCTPQEKVLFSCVAGKKIVSLCASPALTPKTGTVQYRFGPPGRPERLLPTAPAHPRAIMKGGTLMFSGGGAAYLRIPAGAFSYVLYAGAGKGWKKTGVAVEKDSKLEVNLSCKGLGVSELGPGLFEAAGIPQYDGESFDLP